MKHLLRCFVKMDVFEVNEVSKSLYNTSTNQLENDDYSGRCFAFSLSEEGMNHEITCFYNNVRQFYVVTVVKKLLEKFPFTSTFLSD